MDYPLFDFAIASILMGLGIGTDVAIATLLRANQLNTRKLSVLWIVGVCATHTLFPMVGYLLSYFSIQMLPALTPLIGLLAFACIFYYLKDELQSFTSEHGTSNDDNQITLTLGLILAVSWDALWSGPAKSAQVIGWPELLVWMSFVLVGLCVCILAVASLNIGRNKRLALAEKAHKLTGLGQWIQYSVIAYFGLLALLRYTLQINVFWWQILLISSVLIATIMVASKWVVEARNNKPC